MKTIISEMYTLSIILLTYNEAIISGSTYNTLLSKKNKGRLNPTYLRTKYCAEIITESSEQTQTIAEPILPNLDTNKILSNIPVVAPITELVRTALSFFSCVNIWIIKICSYPITRVKGITIRIGIMAPS